jgi:hypothetical protein
VNLYPVPAHLNAKLILSNLKQSLKTSYAVSISSKTLLNIKDSSTVSLICAKILLPYVNLEFSHFLWITIVTYNKKVKLKIEEDEVTNKK